MNNQYLLPANSNLDKPAMIQYQLAVDTIAIEEIPLGGGGDPLCVEACHPCKDAAAEHMVVGGGKSDFRIGF